MPITGLGPHGERASPPQHLKLSDAEVDVALKRRFTVAVVLHTTGSDWAKQQLAGIADTLGRYSAAVIEVVDCSFDINHQISALERLIVERPDAIISIPIGNTVVADVHRSVSRAGIKLILLDNAPTGLLPGSDYVSVVSADNFGLGQIAAELLSPHLRTGTSVGIISYGVDFFATNERVIAFRKWMENSRPDLILRTARFIDVNLIAAVLDGFLGANPEVQGLFAVWDDPAMQAVAALRARSKELPITTVDLGKNAAIELAGLGLIKGIAAQRPYDQGIATAMVTLQALVGQEPPAWVVLPGLAVTPHNVIEAYQMIWHIPASPELIKAQRRLP